MPMVTSGDVPEAQTPSTDRAQPGSMTNSPSTSSTTLRKPTTLVASSASRLAKGRSTVGLAARVPPARGTAMLLLGRPTSQLTGVRAVPLDGAAAVGLVLAQ